MSVRARTIASTLGAALLFCLPLIPEILGARRLVFRDAATTHWPWARVAAASLEAGEVPHLNPTASGGQPLLANPNASLLYPTQLLFFALPPAAAFNLHYLLHAIWALAGARALARRLGLSEGPAFLAGAAFAFSGMMLSYVSAFWNSAAAASWMPWAAAAAIDLARATGWRGAIRPIAALAIAGALQALAGEPALSLLTILVAGLLGLLEATASPAPGRAAARFLASGLAAGLLSALIAAPLLLPLSQIVSLTSRGQRDFSLAAFSSAAMAPWRLTELLFPRFDGDPGSLGLGAHWQYELHPGDIVYIWSVTLGVLPLFLILAGAAAKEFWNRRTIALGAGAFVALLLAFGTSLPFYRALYEIAPLRRLRYPIKFWLIVTLAAALLAGFAAERLLDKRPRRAVLAVLAGGAGLVLVALFVAAPGGPVAQAISPHLSRAMGPPAEVLDRILETLRSDALLGLAAIALLALILFLRRSLRLRAHLLGFAAVVLALPWGLPLFVAADTKDLSRPPAILASMTSEGRLWTSEEIGRFEWRSEGTSHPSMELRYSRLARVQIEELAPSTGAAFGVRYLFDKDPDGSYGFTDRLAREVLASSTPAQKARMLAAFGGRWVLSAEESEGLPGARAVTGFTVAGRRLVLWELPQPAAELRWAGRSHGRRSLSGALELVREEGFRPDTDIVLPDRADRMASDAPSAAQLSEVAARPARASATVDAAGAGWVVLARTYFPAWKATLDGRPARVLLANGRDVAVAVPQGRHRIELWWDEGPFVRGVLFQVVGALLALAAVVSSRARGNAAAGHVPL